MEATQGMGKRSNRDITLCNTFGTQWSSDTIPTLRDFCSSCSMTKNGEEVIIQLHQIPAFILQTHVITLFRAKYVVNQSTTKERPPNCGCMCFSCSSGHFQPRSTSSSLLKVHNTYEGFLVSLEYSQAAHHTSALFVCEGKLGDIQGRGVPFSRR